MQKLQLLFTAIMAIALLFVACGKDESTNPPADLTCEILGQMYDENTDTLDLCFCELQELPDCIGNLTNLEWLWLGGNNFSDAEKQKIESWLPNCTIYC